MPEESQYQGDLVSVVICAYNNWPDLEMAIQSALQQSYRLIEVIVVDNSSADATSEEVPRRFGDRVRYIRQPNRECAGAYNAGLDVGSGEFIQFMDGDDVLAPNKIQKQVATFRAHPELDIVYGDVRMFQTEAGPANWNDIAMQPVDDMLMSLTTTPLLWLNTLGILFRRRAFEKVGRWDESLYVEDADYYLRAAAAGCRFGYCSGSPMGFGRLHSGQKLRDSYKLSCGIEEVWVKALGYLTREPCRSRIVDSLARQRFDIAVGRFDTNGRREMTRRQALDKLAQARATSPEAVSALEYAMGCAIILLPGAIVSLARSRWIRQIRRILVSGRKGGLG